MTTEDDFQRALDAEPDAWQTRLVFADWLDEHGDPRAEGYRALGVLRRWPTHEYRDEKGASNCCPYWAHTNSIPICESIELPLDWFRLLEVDGKSDLFAPAWVNRTDATRRELEDAAAVAFARLPSARRAELLALEPKQPARGRSSDPAPEGQRS